MVAVSVSELRQKSGLNTPPGFLIRLPFMSYPLHFPCSTGPLAPAPSDMLYNTT
jgi:hypothetical protein